jgi:hypothetical protein
VTKGGNNYGAVALIAREIDRTLDGIDGDTVTVEGDDYYIPGITREQPLRTFESKEGVRYWHMGGIYRINVDPTT